MRILVFIALLVSGSAWATTDEQREILNRAAAELEVVADMLRQAQRLESPGDPEVFAFDAALIDVLTVSNAIKAHVERIHDPVYRAAPLRAVEGYELDR